MSTLESLATGVSHGAGSRRNDGSCIARCQCADGIPPKTVADRQHGGRIDIEITRRGERCVVRVTNTGAGLHESTSGLRTGLKTLRERLHIVFGDAAYLRLTSNVPRGAIAEIDMPAQP